jgi:hypothetical protein
MAISTNGTVLARLAGGLYNTQMSNATYSEVKTLDPSALANTLYARDFASATDLSVATTLVTNLGLTSVTGLTNWVAAQLTAAGTGNKGAKVVDLLNSFAQLTADTTYGAYATAFNTKVDAALVLSQTTGNAGGTFAAAGVAPAPVNGTFALTTSIDTIVGGAGDDTITAAATSASTGTANTTVNSGDSVDGGDGKDTLTITVTSTNNNSLSGLTVKNVETVNITGVGNLTSSGGAAAVTSGVAEVDSWAFGTAAATSAAAYTVVVNGITYSATASGTTNANAITAVKSALTSAFGNAVTLADSGGTVTVTSNVAGVALPAYTLTAGTGGLAGTKTDTAAARLATDATAIREILTYTPGATLATTDTYKVVIDGVTYTSATPAGTTAADANTVIAAVVNSVLGAGTAVGGSTLVITGSSTGAALPNIGITTTGVTTGQALTVTAAPRAVGATTGATNAISAAQFVGATEIGFDGTAPKVTGLTTQTANWSGTSGTASLQYASTATSANVKVTGAAGTVALNEIDSATVYNTVLTTATVSGSVYRGAAATTTANATAGSLTIQDNLNNGSETVKTLNLGITSKASLDFTDLSKLTVVDASSSSGALTFTASSTNSANLATVKGGSGNDAITFKFATDPAGTNLAPTTASVSGGAGNDTLTASSSGFGTGTVTINGDAGNDTIDIRDSGLVANVTVNGGDGTDTLYIKPSTAHTNTNVANYTTGSYYQTLTTGEIALISSQVNGVETLRWGASASGDAAFLDASSVSQFATLRFGDLATVYKTTQAITTSSSGAFFANGYVGVGSTAASVAGLSATQYSGALNVNASGGTASNATKTIAAFGESVTVNISAATTTQSDGETTTGAASFTTLSGDVKTATINLTAGADYSKGGTVDQISTVYITPDSTANSSSNYTATTLISSSGLVALGNLTSVTLSGNGNAVIVNTGTSKLASINASALGGVKALGANAGDATGGLTVTTGAGVAETITLGSGLDSVNIGASGNIGSYFDKMDTITGLKLVSLADGITLDTAKSDDIAVYGVNTSQNNAFIKAPAGVITATGLGAALTQAAANSNNSLVFQLGGDTYIYVDNSTTGVLDSGDVVVKLTGAIDLDLLVTALNS